MEQQPRKWCFWSSYESIENETLSVMAIVETVLAVPFYWWIATKTGFVLPLILSACIAPLLLLRSRESIDLALKWAKKYDLIEQRRTKFEDLSTIGKFVNIILWTIAGVLCLFLFWYQAEFHPFSRVFLSIFGGLSFAALLATLLAPVFPESFTLADQFVTSRFRLVLMGLGGMGLVVGILVISFGIRFGATCRYLPIGLRNMPRNFRVLALCTSPTQKPELIPGANTWLGAGSAFSTRLPELDNPSALERIARGWQYIALYIAYSPAWLYRLTIKSTAWFWFPIAFLGEDLGPNQNQALLRWRASGSLWAKTTVLVSFIMIASFLVANLVETGAIFQTNPLLTPLGYLLLIDWTPRVWQISALAVSVLSIALIFMLNAVSGEYRIAQEAGDQTAVRVAEWKFNLIQRCARLKLLCALVFWCLVVTQALLYFNGKQCWFEISPRAKEWTQTILGNRFPPDHCT